jgi:P-type Cu+ transporter
VVAGRERFVLEQLGAGALDLPAGLRAARDEAEAAGRTVVFAGWEGQVRAPSSWPTS